MSERTRTNAALRIVACFLCAFLIGASLDAIPDPPAVTQHTQHSLASQVDQNRAMPAAVVAGSPVSFFHLLTGNLPSTQLLEAALPSVRFVLMSQATDTSPPSLS